MKTSFLILYTIFLIFCVIFSFLFVDPNLIYLHNFYTGFFGNYRIITTVLFISLILGFFAIYWYVLNNIKQGNYDYKDVKKLFFITCSILLFSYPAFLSFDIFNYIATAKVLFFYKENPYIMMPINFAHDPLLLFMHAPNKTALYALVWIIMTGVPYVFGLGNFLLTLLNFKIIELIFYFATTWLLWKMTKNLFQTAFFALNPLILIETLMSGHNDISMIFFLLVSFYFLFTQKKTKSFLFFLISIGIKYATGILAPLYVWQTIKPLEKKQFFRWATVLMYCIFFLSSFREEIYPWYALWFLLPSSFLAANNLLTWISVAFSFGLLLRYIPFLLLGTYFGPTPILKIVLMFLPVFIGCIIYIIRNKKHISFL